MPKPFIERLENKVREQIRSDRVGYLLGAGSSYLNGEGYPIAFELWDRIKDSVPEDQRAEIQEKIDQEGVGIERALDLLDDGTNVEGPHRFSVVKSMAKHFLTISASLDLHRRFVLALTKANRSKVPVFSLNYDPLMEKSAEREHIRVVDGFSGHDCAFFDNSAFAHDLAIIQRDGRGLVRRSIPAYIQLIKLHGSLGWFYEEELGPRRTRFDTVISEPARPLMIPPQYRKVEETITPPYHQLWSYFRGCLIHGPEHLNRLLCIGYGMADEHVNAVIESALGRSNFTLIIITKELSDEAFARWSQSDRAIIVTEARSSLYGESGDGHQTLSNFEGLVEEVSV